MVPVRDRAQRRSRWPLIRARRAWVFRSRPGELQPLAAGLIAAGSAAASAQDADAGKGEFNKCRACHSTDAGKNMVGRACTASNGRKAGSVEGFDYSDAMKASGKTWDEQRSRLHRGPQGCRPRQCVRQHRETDRKNLIAFQKTQK